MSELECGCEDFPVRPAPREASPKEIQFFNELSRMPSAIIPKTKVRDRINQASPEILPPPVKRQAFNVAADTTLNRCQDIHAQRGSQYADTWDLSNVHAPVLSMALRHTFGFNATPEELRIITAAALCDVKDSRLIGAWHVDNMDDGINYRAALAHWMQEYINSHPELP